MAQQQEGVVLDKDQFCCSICLDLLKEPVTVPCGHSYCSSCIGDCWDQDEKKGVYSCPQCRQHFSPRPALKKNNMLAEVVEQLRRTGDQQTSASAALTYAGPGDVACDFCTGTRRHKALMSCLACLASFCEPHLQPHHSIPVLKRHKLVKAAARLQDKMCSSHNKLLEVYCRADQQCICYLCTMDEHKGHDTVSAAAERTEKQKQLGKSLFKVQERVQEREKELKALRLALESLKSSAQTAVETSEKIFSEMIHSMQMRRKEVKDLIGAQEKTAVSEAEGVLRQLEQEIEELRRREVELEQLEQTDDHIHFIQGFQSFSSPSVSPDLPSISVHPLRDFRNVSDAVSELRDKLKNILKETWPKISAEVSPVAVLLPPEPGTREYFLQYACPLSLDPNTVCEGLSLSVGNRKVTHTGIDHGYTDHPERFTYCTQVLCREGQSARCYWEVEWTGNGGDTAVSYKDIQRTSLQALFGCNDKSWRLCCNNGGYMFTHNNVETKVSGPPSSRIGMYLDHKAGTLSFYSVSDTMTLLHTVQTTFTRALYPGIGVYPNGTAELSKIW